MSKSFCELCRSGSIGEHTCRLQVDSQQLTGGWMAKVLGRTTFSAVLRDKKGPVWFCAHEHARAKQASYCAEAQLRDLQSTSVDVAQLPRPRRLRAAESVAAHAPVPGLTDQAWEALKTLFHGRCRYCGQPGPLQREHRIPMSRHGENRITNIVPACPPCNISKGSATEAEYLAELRRLWGRRVPRSLARLDERLAALERRYRHGGIVESRAVTLLRSLQVPEDMWPTPPHEAHMAIHRGKQHPIAGVTYRSEAIRRALGGRDRWEGNVALIPQPDNPYDTMAVAVVHPRGQLGFLPAPVATEVSAELQNALVQGRAVAARCVVFQTSRGLGGRVKFDVPLRTREP